MTDSPQDAVPLAPIELPLRGGKTLHMHEPTMLEWCDGEEYFGRPAAQWFAKIDEEGLSFDLLSYLVWLACRRHGLSEEQQLQRQWAMTLDQLRLWLTPADVIRHQEAIVQLFTSVASAGTQEDSPPTPSEKESVEGGEKP